MQGMPGTWGYVKGGMGMISFILCDIAREHGAVVAAGVPVDAVDPVWGGHPLRTAAENGRAASVRTLLELGADPTLPDAEGRGPLELCRASAPRHRDSTGHATVEALLVAHDPG